MLTLTSSCLGVVDAGVVGAAHAMERTPCRKVDIQTVLDNLRDALRSMRRGSGAGKASIAGHGQPV